MPEYDITWELDRVLVSRNIVADSLDEALKKAREMKSPTTVFQPKVKVSWIDGDITVKGVYEL